MTDLRKVLYPPSLFDSFSNSVHKNTVENRETIGVLCGVLNQQENLFEVTHLILPEQVGASDHCQVTELGERQVLDIIESNNIIYLGWIHTHPQFDVFMSSVDLHNHLGQQCLLAEAFAVVVNPNIEEPRVGLFHLTECGLHGLSQCQDRGFHEHENGATFYQVCYFAQIDSL
ncbi:PREDICTED: AMSH-like protease [Priapulus caudatus]|uniref:AMSH-like protease n=1 Tax=Priapulus caudatus TaxID=37621 RepID=A0ABM1EYK3_PRICU|nr:PREDICTED: AMSH-like protease [Priapulus caudatus]